VRPFPNASGGRWQISSGGGSVAFWSKKGSELFYETPDYRIMVVDYSVEGGSFVPGKPRLWSDKQLFFNGGSNLDLAPGGKRFAVLALPDTPPGDKGTVHVTMLLNFFDELKRKYHKRRLLQGADIRNTRGSKITCAPRRPASPIAAPARPTNSAGVCGM
jgi:hypothetical protein